MIIIDAIIRIIVMKSMLLGSAAIVMKGAMARRSYYVSFMPVALTMMAACFRRGFRRRNIVAAGAATIRATPRHGA